MPMRLASIVVFAVLCFYGAAQAQAPIKDGDILTGTLRVVNTRHDNGTKIVAYQIVSKPRAMPAADDYRRERRDHVPPVRNHRRCKEATEGSARQAGLGEGRKIVLRPDRLAHRRRRRAGMGVAAVDGVTGPEASQASRASYGAI